MRIEGGDSLFEFIPENDKEMGNPILKKSSGLRPFLTPIAFNLSLKPLSASTPPESKIMPL